jgi:hypothetical protein
MSGKKTLLPDLQHLIVERYTATWHKSLIDVYHLDDDFLQVDPQLIRFAMANRKSMLQALNDPAIASLLIDLFVSFSMDFSYKSNQFIHLTSQDEEAFRRVYRAFLEGMRQMLISEDKDAFESLEHKMGCLLREHFADLRAFMSTFLEDGSPSSLGEQIIFQQTICQEYSPELQLRILGIHPQCLVQPILDVGCGASSRLVEHLRVMGLQAVGVDRSVRQDDHLIRADWLQLSWAPGTWGTIISHMAFSNHFIFQHMYRRGIPENYARYYAAMLSALKPGGSLYYAPGLPFIERFLSPAEYTITRRSIAARLPGGVYPQQPDHEDVFYACHVMKVRI